jgi:hypothetical protein
MLETETQQNEILDETEIEPDFEMETVEVFGTLGEIIARFGGSQKEWENTFAPSSSMKLDASKGEIVDRFSGASITEQIKKTCSPEEIAKHQGLVGGLRANPEQTQFLEYKDGDTLNVMAFKIEGGFITTETWSRQVEEMVSDIEIQDLEISHDNKEMDEEGSVDDDLLNTDDSRVLTIDLNAQFAPSAESSVSDSSPEVFPTTKQAERQSEAFEVTTSEPAPSIDELFESLVTRPETLYVPDGFRSGSINNSTDLDAEIDLEESAETNSYNQKAA